jgi:hypothetical protein
MLNVHVVSLGRAGADWPSKAQGKESKVPWSRRQCQANSPPRHAVEVDGGLLYYLASDNVSIELIQPGQQHEVQSTEITLDFCGIRSAVTSMPRLSPFMLTTTCNMY